MLFVGCVSAPRPLPTVDELNAFGRVHTLMKAQGGMAQPLFKKTSWTEEEWAQTSTAVERLKLSSGLVKTKFSKDEQWTQLAEAVEKQLDVVNTSVQAKDAAGAQTAFADLRKSCNACHAKKYKVD
jgi:hypothetical protein